VGRPSQMLGDQRWLVALNERTKALQMGSVEILRAADRHAHAVQRYRVVTADSFQCMMRRTAGAHIVFGMDLEETVLPTLGEDCGQMFMLEARAGEPGKDALLCVATQTRSRHSLRLLLPPDIAAYADRSRITAA
jgi:hypothetical protein